MNILPFVAIFLILLGIFSSSFLQNGKIFLYEKKASLGFLAADRKMEEKMHLAAFEKAPEKKHEKKESKTPKEKQEKIASLDNIKVQESRREKKSTQSVNLYFFFEEELDPKLYAIYENFFKSFYSDAAFYQNSCLKEDLRSFLDRLRKQGSTLVKEMVKKNQDITTLTLLDFYPTGLDQDLYYHMLRGTNLYDPNKKIGYPAMEEAFCYLPMKNQKIFSFKNLNPKMLENIFSMEIAESILQKEAEKRLANPKKIASTLTMEELKDLLHKKHASSNIDKTIEFLNFSSAKEKDEMITVKDFNTNVILKRKKRL
ncbi:hypothetical protein COB11_01685 [Candidatus Aerophobetes bacterium]|uniref:Uncharacterized protein n=1 Tax=Aerophobetes bacterium TaxID=2030807 RepID=A0A2A4YMA2_UNCAE|nr:MAG: hypothetical protein COB11_01685 [Candidatus Aerophobetes bacterium]